MLAPACQRSSSRMSGLAGLQRKQIETLGWLASMEPHEEIDVEVIATFERREVGGA